MPACFRKRLDGSVHPKPSRQDLRERKLLEHHETELCGPSHCFISVDNKRICAYIGVHARLTSIKDLTMTVNTLPANEECNCFAVRATARHVSQSYDQFLAPAGLRTTQFSILTKLKRKGPVTINTLAEDMVMDRTTLGRNILPLERDGLIRIEPSASDRRAKELHLTKAGEKRLQAALKRWSQAQARFETVFGAKRAADLRALLRAAVRSQFAPAEQFTDR